MKNYSCALIILFSIISGCSSYNYYSDETALESEIDCALEKNKNTGDSDLVVYEHRPWISATSVPKKTELDIPNANKIIRIDSSRVFSLHEALSYLSLILGTPVVVKPDIYQISSNYTISMRFIGKIKDYLNYIASSFDINWSYSDNKIEFYKLITKNIELKILPSQSYKNKLTDISYKSSSDNNKIDGINNNDNTRVNIIDNLSESIHSMLTPLGHVVINKMSGIVSVTDTTRAVKNIEELIDQENLSLTRQIHIKIDLLTIKSTKDNSQGLDWNLIYKKLSDSGNDTPVNLKSTDNSISFIINSNSPMDGISALIYAIGNQAKILSKKSTVITTLNRQVAPVEITRDISYLASTSTNYADSSQKNLMTGFSPGLLTIGYIMNVLPIIIDNNKILLQLELYISNLGDMKTISSGSGIYTQSIQTPEINKLQLIHRALMAPNHSLLISSFSNTDHSNNSQRGLFNLSSNKSYNQETTIVLISPWIDPR